MHTTCCEIHRLCVVMQTHPLSWKHIFCSTRNYFAMRSHGAWNSQCMHLWLFPLGDIPVPLMWTCSMCLFTLLGLASITLQWGQGLLLFLEHIFFFSFMYTTLSSSQMPFTRCKSKFFCWIKFFLQFSHCTDVPLCSLFTCFFVTANFCE